MATSMPPLNGASSGRSAKKPKANSRTLALPKISEQGKSLEGSSTAISSAGSSAAKKDSGDGGKFHRKKKVIAPTVQELTLDTDSYKMEDSTSHKTGSRHLESSLKSRLGLSSRKRRPLTATWPQENSELLLNISNLATHNHRDTVPKEIAYAKSYPVEGLPSLEAKKTSGVVTKSSDRDIASLCVGITETWKASSLQPLNSKASQTSYSRANNMKVRQRVSGKASVDFPALLPPQGIVGSATGSNVSRTNSRMGRNSLDEFLRHNTADFSAIKPKLTSQKVTRERDAVQVSLSPLSDHDSQLLHLRGIVRNPVSPHRSNRLEKLTAKTGSKSTKLAHGQEIPQGGTRRSLKTPYSVRHNQNGDVPIPLPPNPFDDAYRIFTYVAL